MALFGDSKRIGVMAEAHAKSGREDQVREALLSLVGPSRKEAGCLKYDLFEDKQDDSSFLTCEEWESEDALERHLQLHKIALNELKTMLRDDLEVHVLKQVA